MRRAPAGAGALSPRSQRPLRALRRTPATSSWSAAAISGHIRYLTDDGQELVAGPGDHLLIEPGHRAWVVGDEPCVTIDLEIGEDEDEGHDHGGDED